MPRSLLAFCIMLPLLAAGCGEYKSTVSGTVTMNGAPVDGFITFFPVASPDNVHGATITAGQYEVADLPPGKRRVLVSTSPQAQVTTGRDGTSTARFLPPRHPILAATPGNNQIVEITGGDQVLDIQLKPPRK